MAKRRMSGRVKAQQSKLKSCAKKCKGRKIKAFRACMKPCLRK